MPKLFDVDALEITFSKKIFGLRRDVKFSFTYASPIGSPYTRSRTENILEKIETRCIDDGGYIIMGDLNGKTKTEEDFVRDKYDKHSHLITPNTGSHQVDKTWTNILLMNKER